MERVLARHRLRCPGVDPRDPTRGGGRSRGVPSHPRSPVRHLAPSATRGRSLASQVSLAVPLTDTYMTLHGEADTGKGFVPTRGEIPSRARAGASFWAWFREFRAAPLVDAARFG